MWTASSSVLWRDAWRGCEVTLEARARQYDSAESESVLSARRCHDGASIWPRSYPSIVYTG